MKTPKAGPRAGFFVRRKGAIQWDWVIPVLIAATVAVGAYAILASRPIVTDKSVHAQNDLTSLVLAIDQYYDEYQRFPIPGEPTTPSRFDSAEETHESLIGILLGFDEKMNEKGINFLPRGWEARGESPVTARSGLYYFSDTRAKLVDPWGNLYHAILDTNMDEVITGPHGKETTAKRAIFWSSGPDKRFHRDPEHEDNRDNIYSWRP